MRSVGFGVNVDLKPAQSQRQPKVLLLHDAISRHLAQTFRSIISNQARVRASNCTGPLSCLSGRDRLLVAQRSQSIGMGDTRSVGSNDKGTNSSFVWAFAGAGVALVVAVPTALWFSRLVSKNGFEGALRLIWEGSAYRPGIRERMEVLDEIDDGVDQLEHVLLSPLELGLETALSSGKSPSPSTGRNCSFRHEWEATVRRAGLDLRKTLAGLSDQLDKFATKVDAVNSAGEPEVKARKKAMSSKLVDMMQRVDHLVHFFATYGLSTEGESKVTTTADNTF
jgi:hypothetical protein